MDELLFTPAAVLDLLTQVDELKDYNIGIAEGLDGKLQVTIGPSTYELSEAATVDIPVDDEVLDDVSDANLCAYESLSDNGTVALDYINSGVIKEIAKTLLVGGLVRLTGKLLKR